MCSAKIADLIKSEVLVKVKTFEMPLINLRFLNTIIPTIDMFLNFIIMFMICFTDGYPQESSECV